MQQKREDIRNIAIIAHVDHGKTTLVDAMLKQTHTVKDSPEHSDLIMDSMDLERERGITIKAKNASVVYNGVKINIVDTPGHADFGGEVERTLKMADGVLLLVDAKEGPMPQTKFVLRKALELGLRAIVVVNKIDRPDAQIDDVVNRTFDLFVELRANDAQLEFPIIYASAINGVASLEVKTSMDAINGVGERNLAPLFETILTNVPAPEVDIDEPFAMLVLAINHDPYKGKMGTGKIQSGKVSRAQNSVQIKTDGTKITGKIATILAFQGLGKVEVQEALAGDIVSLAGFETISIGETIADALNPVQIPPITIEEPTVRMTFAVNNSPFAGKEGKFVTSRNLRQRLMEELETNVALRVEETGSTDSFLVSGRGELHLGILIETMRREGYELQVSQPEVIFKTDPETGKKMEPYEVLTVDVPSQYQGPVIEELGKRGGELKLMDTSVSNLAQGQTEEIHAEYLIPTRGLIGLKNSLLTKTRGTAILNNLFDSYQPASEVKLDSSNSHGSLIASEAGVSNAYGLNNAQERGILFIGPAVEVYEGMIVGKNAFDSDLEINVNKTKKLSNMRSAGADDAIILTPPREITLDLALEYIGKDELVEVTPKNIRLRKRLLNANDRKRAGK